MLHLLDESLEAFLRATVPLSRREVDVSFKAPDRDWAARVAQPTVNLYLWDVRPNLQVRDGGEELVRDLDGQRQRRAPLPRVDCRYLVTAWTSDIRDEHSLLGATLAAVLRHDEIQPEYLRGPFATVTPLPSLSVAANRDDNADFWSALGGQLKPGLDLVVTATVDTSQPVSTGPDVERYVIRTAADLAGAGERHLVGERRLVGGRTDAPAGTPVSTPRGTARVDDDGRFLVAGEPGDEVRIGEDGRGRVPARGPVEPRD